MDKEYIDLSILIRERYSNNKVEILYYRCIDKRYIPNIIRILTEINKYMCDKYKIDFIKID